MPPTHAEAPGEGTRPSVPPRELKRRGRLHSHPNIYAPGRRLWPAGPRYTHVPQSPGRTRPTQAVRSQEGGQSWGLWEQFPLQEQTWGQRARSSRMKDRCVCDVSTLSFTYSDEGLVVLDPTDHSSGRMTETEQRAETHRQVTAARCHDPLCLWRATAKFTAPRVTDSCSPHPQGTEEKKVSPGLPRLWLRPPGAGTAGARLSGPCWGQGQTDQRAWEAAEACGNHQIIAAFGVTG